LQNGQQRKVPQLSAQGFVSLLRPAGSTQLTSMLQTFLCSRITESHLNTQWEWSLACASTRLGICWERASWHRQNWGPG